MYVCELSTNLFSAIAKADNKLALEVKFSFASSLVQLERFDILVSGTIYVVE